MMLTGRAPDPVASGIKDQVPPIKLLRPDTPASLARLIDEMLDESPRNRVRTAADLRDALTAFIWNERAAHTAPAPSAFRFCTAVDLRTAAADARDPADAPHEDARLTKYQRAVGLRAPV